MKKLPIGIQTYKNLIEEGYYYSVFLGQKELFKGLFLYDRWDWEIQYPVIHITILEALTRNDFDKLKDTFQAFFASIPHDWYRKNQLAGYEGYRS